jgi:hypothetical protein
MLSIALVVQQEVLNWEEAMAMMELEQEEELAAKEASARQVNEQLTRCLHVGAGYTSIYTLTTQRHTHICTHTFAHTLTQENELLALAMVGQQANL